MACRTVSRSRLRPVCTFTSTFNLSRMAASTSRERAQWKHSFSLAGADTSPGGRWHSKCFATRGRARQKDLDGCAMLQNLSKQIRMCLRNAEECANLAKIQDNASRGRDLLDLERRWLRLARGYGYSEQRARLKTRYLVLTLAAMRRRSSAGGEPAKAQRRK